MGDVPSVSVTDPGATADADGTVELPLAPDPASVAVARAAVNAAFAPLGARVCDDLALVVSELVANAVVHGSPEIALRARLQPEGVEVAVDDGSSGRPQLRDRFDDIEATHGRGLAIVALVAARWGVEPRGGGKTVWALVPR